MTENATVDEPSKSAQREKVALFIMFGVGVIALVIMVIQIIAYMIDYDANFDKRVAGVIAEVDTRYGITLTTDDAAELFRGGSVDAEIDGKPVTLEKLTDDGDSNRVAYISFPSDDR